MNAIAGSWQRELEATGDWQDAEDCAELLARLTPRQAEVVMLLAAGYSSKEVAEVLGITHQAVSDRKHRARRRLTK